MQPSVTLEVRNENGVPSEVSFTKLEARKGGTTLPLQINPSSPVAVSFPSVLGNSSTTTVSVLNPAAIISFSPEMFLEKTSLIRYWETEFDILNPMKNRKGDRFFRPIDVKNLKLIYDLLRRRKMTIEGAKAYLKSNGNAEEKYELIQSLEKIKKFLSEMKASL